VSIAGPLFGVTKGLFALAGARLRSSDVRMAATRWLLGSLGVSLAVTACGSSSNGGSSAGDGGSGSESGASLGSTGGVPGL
jgi:hypothetical protein